MRILYVTSFAPDMFECSGERLVRSFLGSATEGTLLLAGERNAAARIDESPRIRKYSLDQSALLRDWLAANLDIIPPHLGGCAPPCQCAAVDIYSHAGRCPWHWFNKNASRWFRKIASLHYAQTLDGYDCLVWLDSDCRFKKRLAAAEVARWFGDAAVFYLKSPDREIVESGVIGFRTDPAGRRFLSLTTERYTSGAFRRYPRWDDGYQFQMTLNEHPEIPAIDLAYRALPYNAVVPASPVGKYLKHHRGLHAAHQITT